jgi:hypothetical protein
MRIIQITVLKPPHNTQKTPQSLAEITVECIYFVYEYIFCIAARAAWVV